VLFISVLLVKFSVEDGKSHWMSGMALVCELPLFFYSARETKIIIMDLCSIAVYILVALSFWHFPEIHRTLQGAPITCA
jgi:Ca2+:H+ antiporter